MKLKIKLKCLLRKHMHVHIKVILRCLPNYLMHYPNISLLYKLSCTDCYYITSVTQGFKNRKVSQVQKFIIHPSGMQIELRGGGLPLSVFHT